MSGLSSSNDLATNGVNGRTGSKTWCKCECCALIETSIEGVCCLEIPEICKPRFWSTSCLNVCRLDPHFVLQYSWQENFISYLISTQLWSLANQNKSFLSPQTLGFSFSVKHFTGVFFTRDVFLWVHFFKRVSDWIQGFLYYWKRISYHLNRQMYSFTGVQERFKWWRTLWDTFSWTLGLISFWVSQKGCFWIF